MLDILREKLTFVSVNHLIGETFFVPDYQRGYRWQPKQVEQLLDDLWYFYLDNRTKSSNYFTPYCLQPIVVSINKDSYWEIIDGQQRLTTVQMILDYLRIDSFCIEYETRNETPNKLDDYYKSIADRTIKNWFNTPKQVGDAIFRTNDLVTKFKDILTDPLDYKAHFIWYNVSEEVGKDAKLAIDIFDRLNIGKIGLTNAELIKALFMTFIDKDTDSESHKKLNQITLGKEWDEIENRLQQPLFWNFICQTPDNYVTRIDYLFDIKSGKNEYSEEKYSFNYYVNRVKNTDVKQLWLEIKDIFQQFENWYLSHEMFHYIGYLITTGSSINDILNMRYSDDGKLKSKKKVAEDMLAKCRSSISGIDLKDDDFFNKHSNKQEIRKVLLLFNVLTITKTKNTSTHFIRFPFDEYRKRDEKGRCIWDIEHVHSQTEKDMDGPSKIDWMYCMISYFTGEWDRTKCFDSISLLQKEEERSICLTLSSLIEDYDDNKNVNDRFEDIYKQLKSKFENDEKFGKTHTLGNLTLLDKWTNRSYQNAFFPVKRCIIINKAKNGGYIPLCTQNVFMKAYTKHLGSLTEWNEHDCEDYREQIINTINE